MKKAIILVVIAAIVGGAIWFVKGNGGGSVSLENVKYADPADAVDYFYRAWLKAVKNPSATPSEATLVKSAVLTNDLSSQLATAIASMPALDPVLCQTAVPDDIVIRNVYGDASKAQMLVTSKDSKVMNQAVIELNKSGSAWLMSAIKCTNGDVAPPAKEFSFEEEGFLIKNSIPKPFSNKVWHIVFSENGKAGNAVPLIFDSKSQCTSTDGTQSVCNPAKFTETSHVSVQGQLTEKGAQVVKMEFLK